MTRRRTTWGSNPHTASAPPATPNEGTSHPAYQPDPSADKYMNGDPSSWGEDVNPGPYPNSAPPADPGMQEPQGHPATDPAHYFPGGSKAASRNLQAAMEQKAAKCIRVATAMLGRKASVDAIEDQALDFMNLSDSHIQAMLGRIAAEQKKANSTLTPPRSAEDLLADDLMVDEDDVDEGVQAVKMADDENEDEDADDDDDKEAAKKKAAHFRRQAEHWEKKAAEEDADEALLAEMMEEEAKKASKKSEEEEESDKEASKKSEDEEEESDKEASKKSEDEEEESDKEASDEEDEDESDKDAGKKAGLGEGGVLADLMDEDFLDEEFGDDPMALMDDSMDESLSADEMMAVYGNKFAGKKKATEEESKKDEPKEEPKKEASRKASALSPKPRVASTGPKTLGSVSSTRTASAEISDLSKLWASSPDVSKVFGS